LGGRAPMPNDEEQVSQELRSSLEKEYDVVGADWRFLIGTRFAMLAFSITLISFLLGVYRYMITAFTDVDLSGLSADQVLDLIKLRNEALRVIPVIGAVTAGLLLLVEWRTRNLYHQGCAQRAEKIEEMLGIENGHFRKFADSSIPFGFGTHPLQL